MRIFLVALALVIVALPAFGKTHVIKILGTEPLFATCSSRDQLFALMRKYPQRETIALQALGLDRDEFEHALRSAQNVTSGAPLHLDAMAYYWGGVKIVRDVELPPHTKLWVSHLSRKTVYIPQLCGNISTVAVAAIGAYREGFGVTARSEKHPAPRAAGVGPNAALPAAPAVGLTPSSRATPKTIAGVPGGPAPPALHHGGFPWWIFLVPVALIHGGGGTGGTHVPIFFIPPAGSSSSPSPSPGPSKTPCPRPTPKPSPTPCPSRTK